MVSIVVPVYNAANYIADTIKMVCEQTYRDWELILVDDASTDNSVSVIEDIIKGQKKRIRLIRKRVNEGAAEARNTGIDASAGRFIAFLDADDVWKRDKLKKQVAFMEATGAAFSFHTYEFGDEAANPTGRIVHAPAELNFKKALSRTVIFTSTVMFDTHIIDMEIIHMPDVPSEDTATWWNIMAAGYTAYGLNENLVKYRRVSGTLSANKVEALRRIWVLLRKVAKRNIFSASWHFVLWAWLATYRRENKSNKRRPS